jgi:transcriptional regulator with XRE-family HTH domain
MFDSFYNAKDPNIPIAHEKPEHRLILWLKAQGFSNREIAQRMGYTEAWVSQVLRQPWARAQLVSELEDAGKNSLETILEASAADSLFTLIDLRDTATSEAVRLNAAKDLLDRFLGKAVQRVESTSEVHQVVETVEEYDKRLRELEAEEARLTGRFVGNGSN